jgi:hypothetical protein
MAVKQYLFRLYHPLIVSETCNFNEVLQDQIVLTGQQAEFHTTDFLCSLNETTADLAQQASQLVYAQSCLMAGSGTNMVVVWELSDDKDADNTTPVIILHPYTNPATRPPELYADDGLRWFPVMNFEGEDSLWNGSLYHFTGTAFPAYGLRDTGGEFPSHPVLSDPWTVANLARQVQSGRVQLQYCKYGVSRQDWKFEHDGSILCNMKGTLASTRFPLWKAAVESLPSGHSGFSMTRQAKLIPQSRALTERVLNGVTSMAQQRRMFIRRNPAISAVIREWHITTQKFLTWFYWNDVHGYQTADPWQYTLNSPNPEQYLVATRVPDEFLAQNLKWLVRFLNLVNIAQGSTSLILNFPGMTDEESEAEYRILLDKLRDENGVVRRYAVADIGKHHEVLRHMVDLTAHIIKVLTDFRVATTAMSGTQDNTSNATRFAWTSQYVAIVNNFALQWPGLVADFYSVFCLLCTWQLTFDPAEPSRATADEGPLRNRKFPYKTLFARRLLRTTFPPIVTPPNMKGRVATDLPEFVPFRLWEFALYDTGYDVQAAELEHEQRTNAADAWFAAQDSARQQRATAAAAARQQYLDDYRAERQRLNMPNPDDVWDYRNYSSWEWWKQKAQEPLNVEYALRAVDIPNELLNPYAFGLGLARNYIPALSRYSDANGWNDKQQPSAAPLLDVAYSTLTVLERRRVNGVPTTVAVQLIGDAAGDLADYLGTNDETYSPRQFWPPLLLPGASW